MRILTKDEMKKKLRDSEVFVEIYQSHEALREKLDIALAALNKLAILQSGALDGTHELNEIVKSTIRETLEKLGECKPQRWPY